MYIDKNISRYTNHKPGQKPDGNQHSQHYMLLDLTHWAFKLEARDI